MLKRLTLDHAQLAALLVGIRLLQHEITTCLRAGAKPAQAMQSVTEAWPQFLDEGIECPSLDDLDALAEQINCD